MLTPGDIGALSGSMQSSRVVKITGIMADTMGLTKDIVSLPFVV